jgi:hypothetical protein
MASLEFPVVEVLRAGLEPEVPLAPGEDVVAALLEQAFDLG